MSYDPRVVAAGAVFTGIVGLILKTKQDHVNTSIEDYQQLRQHWVGMGILKHAQIKTHFTEAANYKRADWDQIKDEKKASIGQAVDAGVGSMQPHSQYSINRE